MNRILIIAVTLSALAAGDLQDARGGPVGGAQVRSRLVRPIGISMQEVPLRDALAQLSEKSQVAILLDRRVDPSLPVALAEVNRPLVSILTELADSKGLGITLLDSVVVIGPKEETDKLRTLAAMIRESLPESVQVRFAQRQSMAWDDFAVPREMAIDLCRKAGIQLYESEKIPHDLWSANALPPMRLSDRLVLILSQFGFCFQAAPGGTAVRPIPIPEDIALVRDYPGHGQTVTVAEKYRTLAPQAEVKIAGDTVYVKGLLEDHERLKGGTGSHGLPEPPQTTDTNSINPQEINIQQLKIDNKPLRPVLEHLTRQLGYTLDVDWAALEQSGFDTNQLISVDVQNIKPSQLFHQLLDNKPIKVQYHPSRIVIRP